MTSAKIVEMTATTSVLTRYSEKYVVSHRSTNACNVGS